MVVVESPYIGVYRNFRYELSREIPTGHLTELGSMSFWYTETGPVSLFESGNRCQPILILGQGDFLCVPLPTNCSLLVYEINRDLNLGPCTFENCLLNEVHL